jgi:hypothetical protein
MTRFGDPFDRGTGPSRVRSRRARPERHRPKPAAPAG